MPVPVVTADDLADGAAVLDLDQDGRPLQALAVVDLLAPATPAALRVAAAAASTTGRILVGAADGLLPAAVLPLVEQLALTLAVCDAGPSTVVVRDPPAAVAQLQRSVLAYPGAALTAAGLLRLTADRPVAEGLLAESLAYSMLLAGPEFASWRVARPRRADPGSDAPVLLERDGDVLHVVLNRPERHNAFGRAVRDALVEGLEIALLDPAITRVELSGSGRSFCSGGDLDEFGTTRDVVAAHLVRTTRSAGWLVHRLSDRIRVTVHGACVGAGIEVPSFAGRVEARGDAWFQLPELRMGLVPGAGGTVSLPRRIGRWRTAWMALSGEPVDLPTALGWGLVDGRADD